MQRSAHFSGIFLHTWRGGSEKRGWRQTPASAIRVGEWKLIENFEYRTTELYNLAADPKETTDLSKTNPAKAKELLEKLHAWQKSTKAFVPTQLNPGYRQDVVWR